MANFKKYTKKNGQEAWQFSAYLGTDPKTGKRIRPPVVVLRQKNKPNVPAVSYSLNLMQIRGPHKKMIA